MSSLRRVDSAWNSKVKLVVASNIIGMLLLRAVRVSVVLVPWLLLSMATPDGDQGSCSQGCSCFVQWSFAHQRHIQSMECHGDNVKINASSNFTRSIDAIVVSNINSKQVLDEVLNDIASFTDIIELTIMDCPTLDLKLYHFDALTHLPLKRVPMKNIEENAFMNFNKLEVLSLENCGVEYINNDAFVGLHHLLHLNISNNHLQDINGEIFHAVPKLESLNISHNTLIHLRDETFHVLKRLRTLDISKNRIRSIDSDCFIGLESLQGINLSDNNIAIFPSQALKSLPRKFELDFSSNALKHLSKNSVWKINASVIKLNKMPSLQTVESDAFEELLFLSTLEMKDNANLKYISPLAFSGVPILQKMDLSGNALIAVEKEMLLQLPSLSLLMVHSNPLICDCNLFWIREDMITKVLNLTFDEQRITCVNEDSDVHYLKGVGLSVLGKTCAPVIPDLFKSVDLSEDEHARFRCHAFGFPKPRIAWILPSKTVLRPGESLEGVNVDSSGILAIDGLRNDTVGLYTCNAQNNIGEASKSFKLSVKKLKAELIILRIADTFVKFTWRRIDDVHRYVVTYESMDGSGKQKLVNIGPYIKSTTASELKPSTAYNLCIRLANSFNANCVQVRTRGMEFSLRGITNLKQYVTGIALGIFGLFSIIGLILCFVIRRYNRINRLKGESQVGLFSSSNESLSSGILFENRGASIYSTMDEAPRCSMDYGGDTTRTYSAVGSDSDEDEDDCTVEMNKFVYEMVE